MSEVLKFYSQKKGTLAMNDLWFWIDGQLTCKHCELTFEKKMKYITHMRAKHPAGHQCDKCEKKFTFPSELKEHQQQKHER